jgi:hypothetical protein
MSDNVIQFPGKGKPASETKAEGVKPAVPSQPSKAPQKPRKTTGPKSGKKSGLAIATIAMLCFAVNYVTLENNSTEQVSLSSSSRGLASVGGSMQRDAAWEKDMSERLAKSTTRDIASIQGRSASIEEKLRWGTLEEKYTITFRQEAREIASVTLQGDYSSPSYVLNREEFLSDYGSLLKSGYATARLKSVETVADRTIESYTLFDKQEQPQGEVRFELDRHKRLLSLRVESQEL